MMNKFILKAAICLTLLTGCSSRSDTTALSPTHQPYPVEQPRYKKQLEENYIDDGVQHLFEPLHTQMVIV